MAAAVSTGRQPGIGDNFILEHAFTMEELCAQLGKSRRTWYRLEAAGRTPPVIRVGAQRYYLKSSVVRWLEEQEQAPRPQHASRPVRRWRAQ